MSDKSSATPAEGARPDGQSLIDRATAMRPLLERHAAEQELLGELHEEVVQAFHDSGLFGMTAPRVVGGLELTPRETIAVVDRVAYADASAGWVLFAANVSIAAAGAFLGQDSAAEVFGGDTIPVIAGQGTRLGAAVREENGFRLSGEWNFGSGVKHAQWIHSGGQVGEKGEPLILVVPRSEVQLAENWDVMGLRGTGSIDYAMTEVRVPASFVHPAATTEPLRGGSPYRVGLVGFTLIGHTGWALGVGRRLLDELRALVVSRTGRPGSLTESDAFQIAYAEAEARMRSAKALVNEVWEEVELTVDLGGELSVRQHTLMRLALSHATLTAQAVGQFVYQWSGTTGLRSGPIQRFFRDLHAGTQHITSGPAVQAACGRELAGSAPGHSWFALSLIES